MLEKMADFFENRLDGYDEHMMTNIEAADEFYPFTAKQLLTAENCNTLDLGCGTGLELEEYYLLNPSAKVTGVDLSQGMLSALKKKFADKDITLICDSYFDALCNLAYKGTFSSFVKWCKLSTDTAQSNKETPKGTSK